MILYIILGFVTLDYFLERVLEYLNLKAQKPEVPEDFKSIYNEEKYKKSLKYNKELTRFSWITSTFSLVLIWIILLTGFFGWLDIMLRPYFEDPRWLALAFFGVIFIASDILNIPFQVYSTFVIEEKYGFNKTTTKLFIIDKLKGYLLTAIVGGLLIFILLTLILEIGQDFWWWFWIIAAVFILIINMFYTSLILPLFNKLTPLEEGELREAIENYSNKVDFPLKNVFVIDGSKRSSKANAFFSGLGKEKKIVLYDTLIENHTKEELVAVLAHEVGHYKKKHIVTGYITSLLQTGLMLFIMSLLIFNAELSYALGGEQLAIHLNLIAFGMLYAPISLVLGILGNIISRKHEYEADEFAAETYKGTALQDALKKLSVDNLSNLFPHPAYVFVHYSHPPLLKRLETITQRTSSNAL
ncbi:MAG: M48 family metallopeptidase [Candidatus Cyclobacteriaceae bacterium M2_1C_046]